MGKTRRERDPVQEMRDRLAADGWTPGRRAAKRQAFREIGEKYGGMQVAYRLVWDGDRLVEPVVVLAANDYSELSRMVRALPPEEQAELTIRYVLPPGQAMGY